MEAPDAPDSCPTPTGRDRPVPLEPEPTNDPAAVAVLAQMTDAVSYLRATTRADADTDLEWLRCEDLVHDGDRLLAVVRSTAAGRGTNRDDIALSLFAQAYAFRVASVAIGSMLLANPPGGDRVIDVAPANMTIALGRHRPNAVALDDIAFAEGTCHEVLFDRHLTPFVATAHAVAAERADNRVGEQLLWGNIATGCAAAFGAFGAAGPIATAFFADAPEQVTRAGQYVADGEGWAWQRNSCCLWFQIPPRSADDSPFYCQDCPRKPAP